MREMCCRKRTQKSLSGQPLRVLLHPTIAESSRAETNCNAAPHSGFVDGSCAGFSSLRELVAGEWSGRTSLASALGLRGRSHRSWRGGGYCPRISASSAGGAPRQKHGHRRSDRGCRSCTGSNDAQGLRRRSSDEDSLRRAHPVFPRRNQDTAERPAPGGTRVGGNTVGWRQCIRRQRAYAFALARRRLPGAGAGV